MMSTCSPENLDSFIRRWEASGAGERANAQLFLSELCDLLDLAHPDPAQPETAENAYVFERSVTFQNGDGTTAPGRIDLYKRGCFVLEAKQGADGEAVRTGTGRRGTPGWDQAMLRARAQAERYIRALPAKEGRPPFLITTDVGHVIELFAEFSQTGGTYIPFPAPGAHRISLADLRKPEIRDRLNAVWADPLSLDPARRAARVTREIAANLAALAMAFERRGETPHDVAAFLMRCLFTMFAEDTGMLSAPGYKPWSLMLEAILDTPEAFGPMVQELWTRMNTGGYSTSIRQNLPKFNGGLFTDTRAPVMEKAQIALLLEASRHDWCDVEPAIFGTLLERALDPIERHKLGAHYTPRAYVERLVLPTVINPVREEWDSVLAAAMTLDSAGNRKAAVRELRDFHQRLCHIRVLDPACGSGNFLYVTLEHLKRIEGEVLDTLNGFGEKQTVLDMAGETVDPHQLLGIEVNPRAAAIAELVLWIGTLQWHFRNRGSVMPPQPIIRDFHNIECRDALIAWDKVEPVTDTGGNPVTHWDGRTTKLHPVTGKPVPDETARVQEKRYIGARKAQWPAADYIVGNPPFIGAARMRDALGDGYTETVRAIHSDIAESSDFVMYWWNHAAELVAQGKVRRFGFVTTNSLRQTFNRRVIEKHLGQTEDRRLKTEDRGRMTEDGRGTKNQEPGTKNNDLVSLRFAIADHPWVDDGAAVRIAMTVGSSGDAPGLLQTVVSEREDGDSYAVELEDKTGKIGADLTIGADVASAKPLRANGFLCSRGVQLIGGGFMCTPEEAKTLGLGRIAGLERHIREYRNGKDLTNRPRGVMAIDLFGLTDKDVAARYPEVYQWILERVKPERDQNNRAGYREKWWIHGEARGNFRPVLTGLSRYIATVETAKHRFFVFLDDLILPDNRLVNFAMSDAYALGVLSSKIHILWTLATGGVLEDRPVYNKTTCFDPFPFPDATPEQQARIRELAEQLDAHRKRQQALHPELTMTGMYNVLEKLRGGEVLTAKDKVIHEQGLVSVLRQLHDDLDAAVAAAYGWPDLGTPSSSSATSLGPQASRLPSSPDEIILERLVALNHTRAAEEAAGTVRWLRPEFQNPAAPPTARQTALDIVENAEDARHPTPDARSLVVEWPKALHEQMRAVTAQVETAAVPLDAAAIAKAFTGARKPKITEILEALAALGQLTRTADGRYRG